MCNVGGNKRKKKEHVNHSEAITHKHAQSPPGLPGMLSLYVNKEIKIMQRTHAKDNAYRGFKSSTWLNSPKDLCYKRAPPTCDEVFPQHLRTFIPGALHNTAVGSADSQAEQENTGR